MIVIASAAYVDSELQSEFGRLPPSFLPVGNLRLFQRQLRVLSANFPGEQTFLSLPESYVISQRDTRALQSASVQVIRVPDDLSLADSVLFVINVIGLLW